ncbi:hypothetical protein [Embleya sp. NPDC001921]
MSLEIVESAHPHPPTPSGGDPYRPDAFADAALRSVERVYLAAVRLTGDRDAAVDLVLDTYAHTYRSHLEGSPSAPATLPPEPWFSAWLLLVQYELWSASGKGAAAGSR